MEPLTFLILFFGGLFAGVVNTIVGGGSLISVPLLITSGLAPHCAIGTNRFAMVFNTGVGASEYYKRVRYNIKFALTLAVFASLGSYLGANIVLQLSEALLKYVIASLMLIMGAMVFYKKKLGMEEKMVNLKLRGYLLISLLSFLLGIYGGFFGAGISTIFTFTFISLCGMSFIRSAGVTRFIVSLLSIVAVVVFFLENNINFLFGIVLTVSFIFGAEIGVKLALKAGNVWIRRMFVLLIVFSSARLILF